MEGYPGSDIESSLLQEGDIVVWRQQHLPSGELPDLLRARAVTKVVVAGIKAGYAVQSTCQVLCDLGIPVFAIRDCIQDDSAARLEAMLGQLLPAYADVVGLDDFVEGLGLKEWAEERVAASQAQAK